MHERARAEHISLWNTLWIVLCERELVWHLKMSCSWIDLSTLPLHIGNTDAVKSMVSRKMEEDQSMRSDWIKENGGQPATGVKGREEKKGKEKEGRG
jgi:hypothetical protein